jgi:hypothetical protein
MKKLIIVFLSLGLVIWGCKREDIVSGESPVVFCISGISKDTVRVNDTLAIYIDWQNSEITDQLIVEFDQEPAKILHLKSDTSLVVIVPPNWKNELSVAHPNGWKDTWTKINKQNYPQVISVLPLTGKGDDVITLRGVDFRAVDNVAVLVNTLYCEIMERTDSVIKAKVPMGCGNGNIRLLYGGTDASCKADITIDIGNFNYNFQSIGERQIVKYSEVGNNYLLERDDLGRVSKRIHLNEIGASGPCFDTLIYGDDGLLDKMSFFYNGLLRSYKIYARNNDGSILEVTEFYSNDKFSEKHEYYYLDGRLVQIIYYLEADWLKSNDVFSYEGNRVTKTETHYTRTGDILNVWKTEIELDIQNGFLPKIGMPGHEDEMDKYPYKHYATTNHYKNFYNEYGELIKVEWYLNCDFNMLKSSYEYE